MLASLRRPTLSESNQVFTAIVFGWSGIFGSVVSFLFSGAVVWALFRLYQRKIALPAERSVLWIGATFLIFFLSEAVAGTIHYGGLDTLQEIAENLPFLGFLLVYARLAISRREDVLRSVEVGAITGAFATFCLTLFQATVMDSSRVEGMAGNAGPFAVICSVLYGVSILSAMRRQGRIRAVAALAAGAAAVALLLSGMRSLWPMLLVAPLLAMIAFRPTMRFRRLGRVTIFAATALGLVSFLTYETVQARFEAVVDDYQSIQSGDYDNSLGRRFRLWQAGVELAAQQPVFGHGPGNAMALVAERTAADGPPEIRFSHLHNFLLNAMVRSGMIGVAALVALLAVPVLLAARTPRDDIGNFGYAAMITVVAAYLFSGSVGIMIGHDILDTLFIYCIIVTSFLVLDERSNLASGRSGVVVAAGAAAQHGMSAPSKARNFGS